MFFFFPCFHLHVTGAVGATPGENIRSRVCFAPRVVDPAVEAGQEAARMSRISTAHDTTHTVVYAARKQQSCVVSFTSRSSGSAQERTRCDEAGVCLQSAVLSNHIGGGESIER